MSLFFEREGLPAISALENVTFGCVVRVDMSAPSINLSVGTDKTLSNRPSSQAVATFPNSKLGVVEQTLKDDSALLHCSIVKLAILASSQMRHFEEKSHGYRLPAMFSTASKLAE